MVSNRSKWLVQCQVAKSGRVGVFIIKKNAGQTDVSAVTGYKILLCEQFLRPLACDSCDFVLSLVSLHQCSVV